MSNKVSAAIWIPHYNIEGTFQLNQYASIYSAEVKAIEEALEFCLILDHTKYIIISDSRSALTSLINTSLKKARQDTMRIKHLIWKLQSRDRKVTFMWVPSHAGVQGNEHADTLAKSVPEATVDSQIQINYQDLNEQFHKNTITKWQSEWDQSEMGRYFHTIHPFVNKKPWFYDCLLHRGEITTINRLRLNHNLTGYHLHRINIVESPECECGYPNDTADHTLFDCRLTESIYRDPFVRKMTNVYNISPVNINNILKNGHILVYSDLAKYIAKTGLKF